MAELEDARQRYIGALEKFESTGKETTGHIRILALENAARHRLLAREAYRRALRRFHGFVLDELIPEDLIDSGPSGDSR